jgi:NTP pyrophosphatase (non-canonical NTP hydrolase)
LNFEQYQKRALKTAIYPKELGLYYTALGLSGEAGEVSEKIKKLIRDGTLDRESLIKELGDVLWYLSALSNELGISLQQVAEKNLQKLALRSAKGSLNGEGDDR